MTYTLMSTLPGAAACFKWKTLRRFSFTNWGCRNYRPCFRLVSTLLEMSVAKQMQKKKHMFKSRVCFDQNRTICQYCPKKPSFQLQYSCVCILDNNKQTRCYTTLPPHPDARIGEWRRTRWIRSSSLHIDIACRSLIKGCLTLWFC